MSKKLISAIICTSLAFTLFSGLFTPIVTYAQDDVIYINDEGDFLQFAKSCSYDAWSVGKTVVLANDISLKNLSCPVIPSFSGSFDGGGHVIKDVTIEDACSPAGLFGTVEKDGQLKNLTVTGCISPDGDKKVVGGIVGENYGKIENCTFIGTVMGKADVGGIVGINRLSGSISHCQVGGEIVGELRTGGIAGNNYGLISSCKSSANVNTVSITPSLSLDEINLSLTLDVTKLPQINNLTMSDTGGICGYSTGIILGCVNDGRVGYPHVGYNVGGVVGRSTGHLASNRNNAEIFGRKDVGGIVGQMEPHVSYDLSEDLLSALRTELNRLEDEIALMVNHTEAGIPNVSDRLSNIITNIDFASDSLDILLGNITDYGDGLVGEVNRTAEILYTVTSLIADMGEDIPELIELLSNGLNSFEDALAKLKDINSFGARSIADIIEALDDASDAFDKIALSIDDICKGTEDLEQSLTVKNKDAATAAIDSICEGLGLVLDNTELLSSAFSDFLDALGDSDWAKELIDEINSAAVSFNEIASAFSTLYEAATTVSNNIDVYWDKLQEGGDGIIDALECFSLAMEAVNGSLDLVDSALSNIISGFESIINAIELKDNDALKSAIEQISTGLEELVDAMAAGSLSLSELSDLLKNPDGDLDGALVKIGEAIEIMSESVSRITDAITKVSVGLSVVFDNVTVDLDAIENGGGLLVNGAGNVIDALKGMRESIRNMSSGMTAMTESVKAIRDAVKIKDDAAIRTALDNAHASIGVIISSVESISACISNSSEILYDAKIWSDNLVNKTKEITDILSALTVSLKQISNGFEAIRSEISADSLLAETGLELIRQGFSEISDASASIRNTLSHFSDALEDIEDASGSLGDMISFMIEAIGDFSDSFAIIKDLSSDISGVLDYIKGIDRIQLPVPSESITAEANKLFSYVSVIENELLGLNGDIEELGSELVASIGRINGIFGNICDNIIDIIYGITDFESVSKEVDEEEINTLTNGRLYSCENYGRVYGDINIGGISGVMGLELTLDPEDDLSVEISVAQKRQYKLKAVIQSCKNYGEIVAKRDNVGGITGKMDFGLIYDCETYCNVVSESGNYIGGIAGISAGLISSCYVKSTLSGGKYVGGIVGAGVNEDYYGDSSMVRDCYSMVRITDYKQYAGAISGANVGEYDNNLFVSELLTGIDRVSYKGKAEPITYEDLIKRRSIPSGFYEFTVKFIADGVVIHTVSFEYGANVDLSEFPEIPVKDGHYGVWDTDKLESLTFDTCVSVIYKPYTTAVGSDEKRDNGREIFLSVGLFKETDKLSISSGADCSDLLLKNGFLSMDTLVEGWVLELPKDGLDSNTVHFLPKGSHTKIFLKTEDGWQQVNTTEFGSYLTFNVSEERIELAVVERSIRLLPIIIIASVVLVAIVTAVVILLIKKKKRAVFINENEKEPKETTA